MEYVYRNIRELRVKQKISQKVICDALGMQQAGYSNLESGNTQLTIERLKQIANFFEIPITYFIDKQVKDLIDELIERNQDLERITAQNSFTADLPDTNHFVIEHHQKVDKKNETLIQAMQGENKANKILVQYLTKDLNSAQGLLNTLINTPSIKKQIKPALLKEIKAVIELATT